MTDEYDDDLTLRAGSIGEQDRIGGWEYTVYRFFYPHIAEEYGIDSSAAYTNSYMSVEELRRDWKPGVIQEQRITFSQWATRAHED